MPQIDADDSIVSPKYDFYNYGYQYIEIMLDTYLSPCI